MSGDPKTRAAGGFAEDAEEELSDIDEHKAAGDVAGLVALARAYRTGSAPGGRDLARCFEAYRAAADLGSVDAAYAVALFHLNGGPVPQDLKEGATWLRTAAERGSISARVFLGNMYELGLHYKADPEKADVWYRNAARSSGVDLAPGTDAHTRALAELGCVRYVLAVVERGGADDATRTRLLAKARAHGHGLRLRTEGAPRPGSDPGGADGAAFESSLATAEENVEAASARGAEVAARATAAPAARASAAPAARTSAAPKGAVSDALAAFGYALLFVLAGVGAAFVARAGAAELLLRGTVLPVFGARTDGVFAAVLALVGVLPTMLVYRAGTVIKAIVAAAVMAGVGWVAWGTGQAVLHPVRVVQALGFAIPGFLAALLVLGLNGGAKLGARERARRNRAPSHPK